LYVYACLFVYLFLKTKPTKNRFIIFKKKKENKYYHNKKTKQILSNL